MSDVFHEFGKKKLSSPYPTRRTDSYWEAHVQTTPDVFGNLAPRPKT